MSSWGRFRSVRLPFLWLNSLWSPAFFLQNGTKGVTPLLYHFASLSLELSTIVPGQTRKAGKSCIFAKGGGWLPH